MHVDLYVFFIPLYVSGAICTHPQEHKLQSTAIGVCNSYGMLIHWSRYWLGHTHTFSTVKTDCGPILTVLKCEGVPASTCSNEITCHNQYTWAG
jgi:hypothetical protein